MNRGSVGWVKDSLLHRLGFNEAPIHESGKFPTSCSPVGCGRASFNEAPIHESGKSLRSTDP